MICRSSPSTAQSRSHRAMTSCSSMAPPCATRGTDDLSCRARTLPDQGRSGARRPRFQAEVLRVRGHAVTEARDAGQPNDGGATEDAWVVDGLRVGASLDAVHVVLVLGDDPRRTALAALGVARAQSSHRRVALGDLPGDAEPIQQLLNGEDLHGLSDSFVFGVSLNKIAQPVPQYGELYVLPSGAEVPAYEDIFTNARWKRLAAGFRETGALLVVAAPAHAAHVADVVGLADGAILVGEAQLADVNVDKLLGRVRAPEPNEDATPASDDVSIAAGSPAPPWWRRLPVPPAAAGLGLALAIALGRIGACLAA